MTKLASIVAVRRIVLPPSLNVWLRFRLDSSWPRTVQHSIRAGGVPKLRLWLRNRQMLEQTNVTPAEQDIAEMDCRALDLTIRQLTKLATFSSKLSVSLLHLKH